MLPAFGWVLRDFFEEGMGLMSVRRSVLVCLVSLCALSAGLVFGSAGALAALSYPFDGQLPQSGSLGELLVGSVAVDDFNEDTYVAESSSGVVDVFETASGKQLASLDGSLTLKESFGGGKVAVTANDGTGDVYVLDETDGVVDVFEPSGGFVRQITGAETTAKSFDEPGGIAVDQKTGEVYVVDANNSVIDVFSVAGKYERAISLASIPGGFSAFYTHGIAVDDLNGDVYVADSGADVVYVFSGTGVYETTWTGASTPDGSFGGGEISVAADNGSGDVYVTDSAAKATYVLEASGGYLTQIGHAFTKPLGTAVDQASGMVYVSNSEPGVVDLFGPGVQAPEVVTGAAEEMGPRSARLNGTVDPDSLKLGDCHFDYVADAGYEAAAVNPYSAGGTAPCVPAAASIPGDSNVHVVSAEVTGLMPGTTYHFRLQASTEGPGLGEDASFATPPPPSIDGASAVNLTASSVDLDALINPRGFDTTYHFEYGTGTGYGSSVPVPDADIGAGTGDVPVTVHVSSLDANTTYHWRVVTRSANGVTVGVDHTFVYDMSGEGLPDGREYEMVTPPQKNAALIGGTFFGVHTDVSEDGSRVIMSSIQCFAGAESCTGERYLEGEPYLFSRSAGGWVTTPLAPPATEFAANTDLLVSANAGTALFSMPTPPAGEDDWYAREPEGSFVHIGPVTPPAGGPQGVHAFAAGPIATTADLSHVAWESGPASAAELNFWPFDATLPSSVSGIIPNTAYEYVGAGSSQPVLVGVSGGAGSTDLISECATSLGASGNGNPYPGSLSADGETVFFTAEKCASGSGVNAGVSVPAAGVYARLGGARTVLISGRSPLECTSASCLESPPADAQFHAASLDGSKAFFLSTQQLMDSASEDSNSRDNAQGEDCAETVGVNGCNLYEYDFADAAGRNLVDVSAGDSSGGAPRVQGVMATAGDGSHVYFVAKGVLSTAANSVGQVARDGADNLYVFERDASYPLGRVSFITVLPQSDREEWAGPVQQFEANVTPDGRFFVFTSHGDLTADDTSVTGALQVFRYDALTGSLVRISVGNDGFDDNGNAGVSDSSIVQAGQTSGHGGSPRLDPTMSNDGSFVFFDSPVGLTPRALNEVQIRISEDGGIRTPLYAENVYEWHEGHVYLISDGRDVGLSQGFSDVQLVGSDASGANVFFKTSDALVAQDTDTQVDVYDAHVCSASEPCSPPVPEQPAGCMGEACHGTTDVFPAAAVGATVSFSGPGNSTPPDVVKPKVKAARRAHSKRSKTKHKPKLKRRVKHVARGSSAVLGHGRSVKGEGK